MLCTFSGGSPHVVAELKLAQTKEGLALTKEGIGQPVLQRKSPHHRDAFLEEKMGCLGFSAREAETSLLKTDNEELRAGGSACATLCFSLLLDGGAKTGR